jgi:hypothetical protein
MSLNRMTKRELAYYYVGLAIVTRIKQTERDPRYAPEFRIAMDWLNCWLPDYAKEPGAGVRRDRLNVADRRIVLKNSDFRLDHICRGQAGTLKNFGWEPGLRRRSPAGELRSPAKDSLSVNRVKRSEYATFRRAGDSGFFNTIDVERPLRIATVDGSVGGPSLPNDQKTKSAHQKRPSRLLAATRCI